MKKILSVIVLTMACFSVSAKSVDWETFQIEVKNKYEWVDYVAYSVYVKWQGDVEAFLNYLEVNGQCGF
jgi:hypothetical protein